MQYRRYLPLLLLSLTSCTSQLYGEAEQDIEMTDAMPPVAKEASTTIRLIASGTDGHVSKSSNHFHNELLKITDESCGKDPKACRAGYLHGYAEKFNVKLKCVPKGDGWEASMTTTLASGGTQVWPGLVTGDNLGKIGGHTEFNPFGTGTGLVIKDPLGCVRVDNEIASCVTQKKYQIGTAAAGLAANTVEQRVALAFASKHCPRALGDSIANPDSCAAPELSAEAKGVGIKFNAQNATFTGFLEKTCVGTCGDQPTIVCTDSGSGTL